MFKFEHFLGIYKCEHVHNKQRPILLTYSSVWSHRVLESIAEPYA